MFDSVDNILNQYPFHKEINTMPMLFLLKTFDFYNRIKTENLSIKENMLRDVNKIEHVYVSKTYSIFKDLKDVQRKIVDYLIETYNEDLKILSDPYANHYDRYNVFLNKKINLYKIKLKNYDKNTLVKLLRKIYSEDDVFGIIVEYKGGSYINPISITGFYRFLNIIKTKNIDDVNIILYKSKNIVNIKKQFKKIATDVYKNFKDDLFNLYVNKICRDMENLSDIFENFMNDKDNIQPNIKTILSNYYIVNNYNHIMLGEKYNGYETNLSKLKAFSNYIDKNYNVFYVETPYVGYMGLTYPSYGYYCFKNSKEFTDNSISNLRKHVLSGYIFHPHPNISYKRISDTLDSIFNKNNMSFSVSHICVGKETLSRKLSIYTLSHKNLDSPFHSLYSKHADMFNFTITLLLCFDILKQENL